jgi:hypothetical protein
MVAINIISELIEFVPRLPHVCPQYTQNQHFFNDIQGFKEEWRNKRLLYPYEVRLCIDE